MTETSTQLVPVSTSTIDPAFLQLMQAHRRGDCLDELSKAMRDATKAVRMTGKAATVTVKFKIQQASGIKGALAVSDDIAVKLPKEDKGGSLFYASDDGALLRDDPNQGHLELKTVTGGPRDGAVELKRV